MSGGVASLSNLPDFLNRLVVGGAGEVTAEVAEGPALVEAAAFVLAKRGATAPPGAVRDFIAHLQDRGAAVGRAGLVREGRRVVFAVVPVRSPGRTTLMLVRPAIPHAARPAAADLVNAACEAERRAGTELAQALVPPSRASAADLLRSACGFGGLATLLYLQKVAHPRRLPPPGGVEVREWSEANRPLFEAALRASYEGSQDCPGLAGRRDERDVLAGHMAAGAFDPRQWIALRDAHGPVGVLLLCGIGPGGAGGREVVYLGLTPHARGRGIGRWLMAWAEDAAAATPGRVLALGVDDQNKPALTVYHRCGLRGGPRRLALVRDLSSV